MPSVFRLFLATEITEKKKSPQNNDTQRSSATTTPCNNQTCLRAFASLGKERRLEPTTMFHWQAFAFHLRLSTAVDTSKGILFSDGRSRNVIENKGRRWTGRWRSGNVYEKKCS